MRGKKTIYNENFLITNSDELYYLMGFILGDGSLVENNWKQYITITLDIKDACILHQFCKWLNIDVNNVKYYRNNTICCLNIYSDICKNIAYLKKFGLVPRKTYNPVIPKIPKKYMVPFLIGWIDADGSITYKFGKEYSLSIVGHPLLMNWFETQLKNLHFQGNINIGWSKNKWKRVRIQRKKDILNLAQLFNLNDFYHICLHRKWRDLYLELNNLVEHVDHRFKSNYISNI